MLGKPAWEQSTFGKIPKLSVTFCQIWCSRSITNGATQSIVSRHYEIHVFITTKKFQLTGKTKYIFEFRTIKKKNKKKKHSIYYCIVCFDNFTGPG